MKFLFEKGLIEDWEGIDYKGYTIEFDRDGLEQAIEQAKEEGHLTYDYNFHIKNASGKEVATAKSLKEARAYIDSHASNQEVIDDLIRYLKDHWYDWDYSYTDWDCFAYVDAENDPKLQQIYKLLNIKRISGSADYDWLDISDAEVISKEGNNIVRIETNIGEYLCNADEFALYKEGKPGTWYAIGGSGVEVIYDDDTDDEIASVGDDLDMIHWDYNEGLDWGNINELLPWDEYPDIHIDEFLIDKLEQLSK